MAASGGHFRQAAVAFTAFSSITNDTTGNVIGPKRKRRSRDCKHQLSLEMFKNLSTSGEEFASPHQLAADGNLEDLKAFTEIFRVTLKEKDEDSKTLLHHAAANNQVAVMQYLIESGIDLNAVDKDGNTALHIATIHCHIDALHVLLQNGAKDTILNKEEDAPLHIAMRSNNTQVIGTFLEYPIELLIFGRRKRTPLHVIAEHDHLEAAEVLHNSCIIREECKKNTGFRLCAGDADDLTPIHLAARQGSHRVLDFMMSKCREHGYPSEVVLGFLDEENSTPLHAAIDGGHTKVVEVLLKHGAKPDDMKDGQLPPFLLASSQGKLEMMKLMVRHCNMDIIFCQDQYGQTALHRCTQAINNTQIIDYLMENGAKISTVDNKGNTPLVPAIISGSLCGVHCLLKHGADPLVKDSNGYNALHHAVIRNRKFILKVLLSLPCAQQLVTDGDKKGDSPIHHALAQGKSALIGLMVTTIVTDLKNVKDSSGNNYLHLAALSGDWRALSTLLDIPECRKLLNEVNGCGVTPLHLAAGFGRIRAVEILLAHGAMIHKCYTGRTPFMFACSRGHVETARLTFEAHPFQLAWTDDQGNTGLHLAAQSSNSQMVTLALDIGVPVTHNYQQESFLDILIENHDTKGTMAAVNHDRWQECLDLVSPFHSHPMISFIMYMPEVAKEVLNHSVTSSEHTKEHPDYWVSYDYKYLRLKQEPEHHTDKEAEKDDEREKIMADDSLVHSPNTIRYKGSLRKSEVAPLTEKRNQSKLSHLAVVRAMVKHKRLSLLIHPVTENYVRTKWLRYGMWEYMSIFFLNFFQLVFMCVFTFLAPRPFDLQSSANETLCATTNGTSMCVNDLNSTAEFSDVANLFRFIALGFVALNFILWVTGVVKLGIESFNPIWHTFTIVDGLSLICTAVYLIPWPGMGLQGAVWEAGALASFFLVFSVVLNLQFSYVFGVYVIMFLAIFRRVLQVLFVFLWFVGAFALSFYILAGNLKPFSTIGYSLFINFAYLVSEINYEVFVEESVDNNLQFDGLTFLFVVNLAIIMGIVIMNLLIGLAVGDIEKITLNAIGEKRAIEISFLTHLDSIFPAKLLHRLDPSFTRKYPNKKVSRLRNIIQYLLRSLKGENLTKHAGEDEELAATTDDRNVTEIATIKDKLEELTMSQERLLEMLNAIQTSQELLMKKIATEDENDTLNDKN